VRRAVQAVVIAADAAVAGGDPGWARTHLEGAALLVAADGGAAAALALGRAPHVVVGDLDSLEPAARAALVAAGCDLEPHPQQKDETDLELALLAAVQRGATAIDVLGALGGPRLDHALANVLALTLPWLGERPVRLLDPHHEVRLLRGPGTLRLDGVAGDLISLLPLTATADGIETAGLRYPLRDETLLLGRTRGVSNELTRPPASVRLRAGLLLVVRHHTRP
jgi:thiamine pyrophosphokinase